jgi:hypothetical protein
MKNDYLWDRSGHDPEIERIERSLDGLRYRPGPAPRISVEGATWTSFFSFPSTLRLAFAGTGLLAVALISIGIWSQFAQKQLILARDIDAKRFSPISPVLPLRLKVKPIDEPVPVNFGKPTIFAPMSRITNISYRSNAKNTRANKTVRLTREERDAFNQLMLALAITGSKLKEIQDKVNGLGEMTAETQTNK